MELKRGGEGEGRRRVSEGDHTAPFNAQWADLSTPGCKTPTMESGNGHVLYNTRGDGDRFEGEWRSPWSPLSSLPLCVNRGLPAVTDTVPFVVATAESMWVQLCVGGGCVRGG